MVWADIILRMIPIIFRNRKNGESFGEKQNLKVLTVTIRKTYVEQEPLGISGMAWGQGELVATPAAVARIASGIANNGMMIPNRYVLNVNGNPTNIKQGVSIASDSVYAQYLSTYMREQSAPKKNQFGIFVAGKTGTPERIVKGESINDGWFVFFAPKPNDSGHVIVCIRIEGTKGSSDAVALAGAHIIPLLLQSNYIKSFDPLKKQAVPGLDNRNELTMRPPGEGGH